jgi:hypothetical protein
MICGKVLHSPVEKAVENFGSNFIKQFKFFGEIKRRKPACVKVEN